MNGPESLPHWNSPQGCDVVLLLILVWAQVVQAEWKLKMEVIDESHSEYCSFVSVIQHDCSTSCCVDCCSMDSVWEFYLNLMLKIDKVVNIWQWIWLRVTGRSINFQKRLVQIRQVSIQMLLLKDIFQQATEKVTQRLIYCIYLNILSILIPTP